ncbi:MAG: hypothetical protein FWC93_06560 [Defluviitaleaceae bacterium]|nr:hypothetical protein [Defluviitaleaceae bacterium]
MASALSYEFLKSIQGAPNGIPTLDGDGNIPEAQLPPSVVSPFKGEFADEAELILAYPTANLADYAYVDDTNSFWYWNAGMTTSQWVNQEIAEVDYLLLTPAGKSMVPYLIVPNPVTP